MKHLILCNEYPPVPSAPGGIGTYVLHIAQLLAESGETVHVIAQRWKGAPLEVEYQCEGRLIIHRVPFLEWNSPLSQDALSRTRSRELEGLLQSPFPQQCFSLQASLLAETLVEEEGIDIIESQEFQAPLYFFQLRRTLGLGPRRTPPCLIHLHSPMEFIALHNTWDVNCPSAQTSKRLEDYSIATADALLCPSQYMANQIEAHHGLDAGSVRVIPLPIGTNPLLEREQNVWGNGTICYVGRLERRKGVVEWLDAAIAVAHDYPTAQFEFIGANCLDNETTSGEEFIEQRIPQDLRARFHFRGKQPREVLPQFLKQARIAVVPSRWENFPNTCVEAMCSGLPVIASREGGMVEMVEDGHTGWLASRPGRDGLAHALRRALDTPVSQLAVMGYKASQSIRRMCDNQSIVQAHLEFRQEIVDRAANRSLQVPVNLPWIKNPLRDQPSNPNPVPNAEGIAIVITCLEPQDGLSYCLKHLKKQTKPPVAVAIMYRQFAQPKALAALEEAKQLGWLVIQQRDGDAIAAKNTAIDKILATGVNPLGFSFLQPADALQPDFVIHGETVLRSCPRVGIMSCWAQDQNFQAKFWMKPCPSFPYQWVTNDIAPFSVVRTEALCQVGYFRAEVNAGNEYWDLFNAVMASGWAGVTVPRILGKSWFLQDNRATDGMVSHPYAIARKTMLNRFPDLMKRDLQDIVLLLESEKIWANSEFAAMQENFFRGHFLLHYSKGGIWFGLKKVGDEIVSTLRNTKYTLFSVLGKTKYYLGAVLKPIRARFS
jgi:glycogen(starch) synthase